MGEPMRQDRTGPSLAANADAASPGGDEAPTALTLDRLIHERVRLGIVSALAANTSLTFTELKDVLDATDGNLSTHARKLEEAGYLSCSKSFVGRVPRTQYALTSQGREALGDYLKHMEAILEHVRKNS